MKNLWRAVAVGAVSCISSPCFAAVTISDTVTCTATGLVCSVAQTSQNYNTPMTGNFGALMPIINFRFTDGILDISNAAGYSYGLAANFTFKFEDLTNPFTDATVISNSGFISLSQSNFSMDKGVVTFSAPFFSATKTADLTVHLGTVGAVPEPGMWAMTILGFGLAGFALRGRRKERLRVTYA